MGDSADTTISFDLEDLEVNNYSGSYFLAADLKVKSAEIKVYPVRSSVLSKQSLLSILMKSLI